LALWHVSLRQMQKTVWFIIWENIMYITWFYIKINFMISGIFGMNLKSYLEEHVVSYCLQSYSMHDLLGSFLKLLAISLVKLTIFVVVMQFAFWLTTSGIIISSIVVFFLMYNYLRARKIFWSDETSNIGNFVTFWPVSPTILF
jgi:hypothetical protein